MAAAATASAGPRYAPEDPTLPKPWRGLVDGKTGYLYFWNPETNVTQYEKPAAPAPAMAPVPRSYSPHVQQQSSQSHDEDGDRYRSGGNGGFRYEAGSATQQVANGRTFQSHDAPDVTTSSGQGGFAKGNGAVDVGSADAYRRRHEITIIGDNVPLPFLSFQSTDFPSEILREVRYCSWEELMSYTVVPSFREGLPLLLEQPLVVDNFEKGLQNQPSCRQAASDESVCHSVQNAGFSAPTPIQAQSWPIALQSKDIVAVAKTGSGKTLGYLLPGFIHLRRRQNDPRMGPTLLVLSPTRELATQIQDEAVKFGKSSRIACTCLYGGAPKGPQLKDIDRGVDIVVATPGRLNDILEMKRISLHQVSYLVLDEADRMLDMGFEPQIRKIVNEVPACRQTLMYTATWPKEVRKIAADLLSNPVQVNIGNVDELVANKSITQHVEVIPPMEKHRRLEQILRSQEPGSKIIVFCSTKKMCDQLARNLTNKFGAAAIHGDKSQSDRDSVLSEFRTGRTPVLVATDVAARGLDIKDIRVVVNYDFPTGVEDYVHRIGRTGRAGATGLAYTFLGEQDARYARDLIKVLEGASQQVPQEVREMASRGGGMSRFSRWAPSSGGRDGRGRGGGGGGRYDSSSGGRGGGGWGFSDRGGGRGSDYGSRDRFDGGGPKSWSQSQNRSRSPSPPKRNEGAAYGPSSGWSFHKAMMER